MVKRRKIWKRRKIVRRDSSDTICYWVLNISNIYVDEFNDTIVGQTLILAETKSEPTHQVQLAVLENEPFLSPIGTGHEARRYRILSSTIRPCCPFGGAGRSRRSLAGAPVLKWVSFFSFIFSTSLFFLLSVCFIFFLIHMLIDMENMLDSLLVLIFLMTCLF